MVDNSLLQLEREKSERIATQEVKKGACRPKCPLATFTPSKYYI